MTIGFRRGGVAMEENKQASASIDRSKQPPQVCSFPCDQSPTRQLPTTAVRCSIERACAHLDETKHGVLVTTVKWRLIPLHTLTRHSTQSSARPSSARRPLARETTLMRCSAEEKWWRCTGLTESCLCGATFARVIARSFVALAAVTASSARETSRALGACAPPACCARRTFSSCARACFTPSSRSRVRSEAPATAVVAL